MGARASHPRAISQSIKIDGVLFIKDTSYKSKESMRMAAKRFILTADKDVMGYIATYDNGWIFSPIKRPTPIYKDTKDTYIDNLLRK